MDWAKMKKEMMTGFMNIGIAAAGAAMTLLVVFVGLVVMLNWDVENVKYMYFQKLVEKDQVVKLVAELCDTHSTNLTKIQCVIGFWENHYNYTMNNETFRPGARFLEEGGVCRDFAINVCATMKLMNVRCDYIYVPDHVFPKIVVDGGYCIYDQMWFCQNVDWFEEDEYAPTK